MSNQTPTNELFLKMDSIIRELADRLEDNQIEISHLTQQLDQAFHELEVAHRELDSLREQHGYNRTGDPMYGGGVHPNV